MKNSYYKILNEIQMSQMWVVFKNTGFVSLEVWMKMKKTETMK